MAQLIGYNWYAFGITHKHAAAEERQNFALSETQLITYFQEFLPQNECAGFITNTCNRTSFFLFGKHPENIEKEFLKPMIQQILDQMYPYFMWMGLFFMSMFIFIILILFLNLKVLFYA